MRLAPPHQVRRHKSNSESARTRSPSTGAASAIRRAPSTSRRYIEDFDQALASVSTTLAAIDTMVEKYPACGNRYTLFAAAFTQFPS